jgi:hypothetical protein
MRKMENACEGEKRSRFTTVYGKLGGGRENSAGSLLTG